MASKKFARTVDTVLSVLAAIALIALMLHVVANAVSRYFFGAPLAGTSELVGYWYLPVLALLGFLTAHWRKEHIRVTLVVDRFRPGNRFEYLAFGRGVGILMCLALAWFGWREAVHNLEVGMTAGVSSIAIWPVSFLVPVVFIMLAVLFIADIVAGWRVLRNPDPESEPAEQVL